MPFVLAAARSCRRAAPRLCPDVDAPSRSSRFAEVVRVARVHSHTHTRQNKSLHRLTRTRAQRLQTCHVQLQWQRRMRQRMMLLAQSLGRLLA